MSNTGEGLEKLEAFLQQIMEGVSPQERRKAAGKIGQSLRRSNLQRVSLNLQPDGTPMPQRQPRKDARGRLRKAKGGRMFRKLRLTREWKIKSNPDGVELGISRRESVAAVHHFGLRGYVGRAPNGERVFAHYPERPLLGFSQADEQAVLDALAKLIDPQTP